MKVCDSPDPETVFGYMVTYNRTDPSKVNFNMVIIDLHYFLMFNIETIIEFMLFFK